MTENEITEKVIGCAINVHKSLGLGLLESAYKDCLFYELKKVGLSVEKEKSNFQSFLGMLDFQYSP